MGKEGIAYKKELSPGSINVNLQTGVHFIEAPVRSAMASILVDEM